jgi:hypothetical protein
MRLGARGRFPVMRQWAGAPCILISRGTQLLAGFQGRVAFMHGLFGQGLCWGPP